MERFKLVEQSSHSFTYSGIGSLTNKTKLDYRLVEDDENVTFAGTPLFLSRDSLKLNVSINDWTLVDDGDYIEVSS